MQKVISFHIHYQTKWGEQIRILGNIPALGSWNRQSSLPLDYIDDGWWSIQIDVANPPDVLCYKYVLTTGSGDILEEEWIELRRVRVPIVPGKLWLRDEWRTHGHPENAFYNDAFLKVIFKPVPFPATPNKTKKELTFRLSAPRVHGGLRLCLLGNIPELGSWSPEHPLLFNNSDFPDWEGSIEFRGRSVIEYKYGLFDTKKKVVVEMETGPNRILSTFNIQDVAQAVINDAYYRRSEANWRGAGLAIPVFSIRTLNSFGVGSFSDLLLLLRWVHKIGLQLVQILPVNDTMATNSWLDSSPYSAISVFALHPLYLDLTRIEGFQAIDDQIYQEKKNEFNALSSVDYEGVMYYKLLFAKQLYVNQKHQLKKNQDFAEFCEKNSEWLRPYVAFCVLRDHFDSPDFHEWSEYNRYSEEIYEKLQADIHLREGMLFYQFLQYHLDHQFRQVRSYARDLGVVLKGDIAIGVLPFSADTWANPHLFYLDRQAGAPPDPFSTLGQNWGLPPYNWEAMASDQYRWWRNRLAQFARYFDAYRIDHILGFFRLWQIPSDQVQGLLGFFSPALPILKSEFTNRKIHFNRRRFCEPYITKESFKHLSVQDASNLLRIFFNKKSDKSFQFKSSYDSQKKIVSYFENHPKSVNRKFVEFLFELHAEVLFIADQSTGEEVYHPRINFQQTKSFKALSKPDQDKLKALHDDYFYSRQEEHWREQGLQKLPVIKSASDMLICGEDLGMIPRCVPEVMRELDILTLEIERMSKSPLTQFAQIEDIPYLSVGSTSSHDMLPLRAWWESLEKKVRESYYRDQLQEEGIPPRECTEKLARKIIHRHLDWPCMWMILPIQDLFALHQDLRISNPMDERINVPGNTKHYWRYRIPVAIEELMESSAFNDLVYHLVKSCR